MGNFLFAVNSTVPVFLVIVLGWFLNRVGLLNEGFNKTANGYVFKCSLPISLFLSVAGMDFYTDFNPGFCLFCFVGTWVMFLAVWGVSWLVIRDKRQIGAFAQASARSSVAVLGMALAVAIYGEPGMVPMMILAAVPFFNVLAVIILNFSPQIDDDGNLIPRESGGAMVKSAVINIVTNPLIIGICLGVPFALLRITIPAMIGDALKSVGNTATPIALLVMGASFNFREALPRLKTALASSFVKLLLLPAIYLPVAAWLGFRDSQMIAILIMTGSPTTVSCYIMAKSMHGDGVLTSNAVMLSTILSAGSLTLWLYVLRSFGLV